MKRRITSILLMLTVAVTMIFGSSASVFGAVTDAKLPASGATKWAVKPGGAMMSPAFSEDGSKLYVAAGRYVYMINKSNGAILKKSSKLTTETSNSRSPIVCKNGKIFVQSTELNGSNASGQVDILDAVSLKILNTVKIGSGQVVSPISYCKTGDKEYIYTGTYTTNKTATYACIDVNSGEVVWNQDNNSGGFYWAGAYVDGNHLFVGSEDGAPEGTVGNAALYSYNPITGAKNDVLSLEKSGDIRSTIVQDNGNLYFTTKGGYFYKVPVEENGKFGTTEQSVKLGAASTSTPVIYDGKAYIGVSGGSGLGGSGTVKAIKLDTMKITGSVKVPGYVQGEMLLSTTSGSVPYIYAAYNYPPGGITLIKGTETLTASTFFTPDSAQRQYGISSVICDRDGTVYYVNDSYYLMAVSTPCKITSSAGSGGKITSSRSVGKGAASYTFKVTPNKYYYVSSLTVDGRNQGSKLSYTFRNITSNHTIKAAFKKVATPTKVKATAGKKKVTVKWKKAKSVNGYQVYRATSSKSKYKKRASISKQSTVKYIDKKLKSKKTYYYKVRSYKKVAGKTVYGAFSKATKAKAK